MMIREATLALFATVLSASAGAAAADTGTVLDIHTAARRVAAAQVPFIQNDGQIDEGEVGYYARLFSGTLFVTTDGDLVYSLIKEEAGWAFRESFVGKQPMTPAGSDPSAIRVSRFMGSRPEQWQSRLRTYDSIDLGEIYSGIRVQLRATGTNVEKLLYVSPGAKVSDVEIAVQGADELEVDRRGRLVLKTGLGDVTFTAPAAYQTIDGERRPVEVGYRLAEGGYGFELGEYLADHEVIIDPLLASTLIGGHNPSPPGNYDDDVINAMVTSGGSIYIAGRTQSPDFPIVLGYDDTIGGNFPDCFVTRMSGDLSTVLASTFIGTEYSDNVLDMAIDDQGRIVIAGQAGWDFPVTEGAYTYSGTIPAGGGFIAKLSPDLSSLIASAIPTQSDYPRALCLGNGGIYFSGSTNNPGFPVTPDAYKTTCCPPGGFGIRPYEGFAGQLSSDLTTLQAMTYLGGYAANGCTVAPDSGVLITDGFDSAVTGYLARFDSGLTTREAYISYYPGSQSGSSRDYFNDVALSGNTIVAVGQTYEYDMPATEGAYDTTCGTDGLCNGVGDLLVPHSDGFIASYSLDLQETLALTFLGGSDHESIRAVAIAPDGDVVVIGETISVDFPTTANAADPSCGTDSLCDPSGQYSSPTADAFIARLSGDLSILEYGSYLGGSGEDLPYDVALDGVGNVFVGGRTDSSDFPTTAGAFDNSYNGGTSDAFIAKYGLTGGEDTSSTPGETCGAGMPLMMVDALDPAMSTLTVRFETGCSAVDNNIYAGPLDQVATYGYDRQLCDVGTGGTTNFDLPDGSFFFVIVGDDNAVEGSYGKDSAQFERPGSTGCGFAQDVSNPCGQY